MRHIPIKCPTCATTYRVGVGNDEDVSGEMDLRIRAQEELEQERAARKAAEDRAEKAERENRELRGVVEAVKNLPRAYLFEDGELILGDSDGWLIDGHKVDEILSNVKPAIAVVKTTPCVVTPNHSEWVLDLHVSRSLLNPDEEVTVIVLPRSNGEG